MVSTSSPPEPPPPPRDVPAWARRESARMMAIAGAVLIPVALAVSGLFYVLFGTGAADKALNLRGKKVMATPVSYKLSSTSQSGAVERYNLKLEFTGEDGKQHTTVIETNHQSQLEAAKARTPLEIQYDPQNPQYARWPGTKLNPLGDVWFFLTGALALLGVFLGLFGALRGRADRSLYRTGVARLGRIDRVDTAIQNRVTTYQIEYSYDVSGERVLGSFSARGVVEPQAGPIWVVVSADDEFRSIPVLEG